MTSIWLLPEGRQEQRLQELINRLTKEHATVAFAPHLTVCGVPRRSCRARRPRPPMSGNADCSRLEWQRPPSRARSLRRSGPSSSRSRTARSCANSASGCATSFGAPAAHPAAYQPPLHARSEQSGAPPDFDDERLKAIAAGCAEAIDDAHFTLGRPVVNSAGGGEHECPQLERDTLAVAKKLGEDRRCRTASHLWEPSFADTTRVKRF